MLGFLQWETLRERGSTQPTVKRFVRQSALAQRTGGNYVSIISAIDIRAEINFALIAKVI